MKKIELREGARVPCTPRHATVLGLDIALWEIMDLPLNS